MSTHKTKTPWDLDVRVRERLLKNGTLSERDVEKYLSSLVDLADQADPVSLPQPALATHDETGDADGPASSPS